MSLSLLGLLCLSENFDMYVRFWGCCATTHIFNDWIIDQAATDLRNEFKLQEAGILMDNTYSLFVLVTPSL